MTDRSGSDRNPLAPYSPCDLPPGVGGDTDPRLGTSVLLAVMVRVVLAVLVPLLGVL
ncbi:hypothetical protein ACFR9U_17905 [Halorientalis brevis]|uniref:Uncharacterized protein n=1 Tax=Halorientalis brevis TaxID=1126241 RepID=A0ABD6CGN6_9EURY|nr:hypothetical protein [Halorientalis brevis]